MNAAIISIPSFRQHGQYHIRASKLTTPRPTRSPDLPLTHLIHHPPSVLPLHPRVPLPRNPQRHPIRRALLPLQHPGIRNPQTPRTSRQQHHPILSLPIFKDIAKQLRGALGTVCEDRSANEQHVNVPGTGVVGVRGGDVDIWGATGGGEGGGEVEEFHVHALGHYVRGNWEGLVCEV
jgi:hypothetical protein